MLNLSVDYNASGTAFPPHSLLRSRSAARRGQFEAQVATADPNPESDEYGGRQGCIGAERLDEVEAERSQRAGRGIEVAGTVEHPRYLVGKDVRSEEHTTELQS